MFQKKKIIAKITDIVSINTLKFKMTKYQWAGVEEGVHWKINIFSECMT